jgi:hypothetical protein
MKYRKSLCLIIEAVERIDTHYGRALALFNSHLFRGEIYTLKAHRYGSYPNEALKFVAAGDLSKVTKPIDKS